ncbi:MAG: DNA repair protein RecN [Anaerolineales bacterium]|nr:DNA repair protein RecN [Anaerolineales bacterium]MCB9128830.1 DNA repair protein RecN [Ardenticatenales bacterium]MCB9171394.1 DNA repair protein RecN [Ardenticatenales bacterium]
MLLELTIRDFAIIEELRLSVAPGFTVMTGETGAGKSIIIDAVGLLLGGRAQTEFVRHGSDRAMVEGIFTIDPSLQSRITPLLESQGLADGDEADMLIVQREINANGRNLCRVNGRTVPLAMLRDLMAPLVDIHGQSDHLSLMNPRHHIDLLDRFANTMVERGTFAERVAALRAIRAEMQRLASSERELALRQDRLQYIVDEISAAELTVDEEETLANERRVLANSEKLSELAESAYGLLSEGVDDAPPLLVHAQAVARAVSSLAKLDETLNDADEVAGQAVALLDDLARTLDRYRDNIEYNPQRLEQIEQRLTLLFNLKRKYGDSVIEILAERERAQQALEEIANAEARLRALSVEENLLLDEIGRLGHALSHARRTAAARMAQQVENELESLRMERARFAVDIQWQPAATGAPATDPAGETGRFAFDGTGLDQVEFLLAPNPGEGLKPLARIASGGEASRIMLAIKTVLGHADDTPTLIFDEIDTGVGGRVGHIVGEKLYGLAAHRQVLCITHLPQLAAFGDSHLQIRKLVHADRTTTHLRELDEVARIEELALMIGGGDAATRAAQALRDNAHSRQPAALPR